jgi:hypothetical protein
MNIDEALRTYLLTVTALTNYVIDRIYPATVNPENAVYPYILYAEINETPGDINEVENYQKYYQLTVDTKNYDDTQAIKKILKNAFYLGPRVQYSGISIIKGAKIGSHDMPYDPLLDVYEGSIDIKIDYIEF